MSHGNHPPSGKNRSIAQAAKVIIVGSVMFSFISYWRVAAIVLGDLASTAFYIGGIVENAIGKAAPFYILAVMLFSYAVRTVYIESCSMFVRGGVYRVVRSAMGGFMGKIAVSALLFDYILTGPISSVSAGQYLMGLLLDLLKIINPSFEFASDPEVAHRVRDAIKNWGAITIAIAITLYFFYQNLIGIHESSSKALRIMIFTTVVAVIMLGWSMITLAVRQPAVNIPILPNLGEKLIYNEHGEVVLDEATGEPKKRINPITGRPEDPLGFIGHLFPETAKSLREYTSWISLVGLFGLLVAFGHSILAMSGEETLAQVYREVESPKLPNFRKAAFVVFLYSFIFTGSVSFLAVMLIPDNERLRVYGDNLLGGLAMNVIGPEWLRLVLNAFVVIAGFLILSGAVNTSIIGSNGVLNRVAEDGVLPTMLQKPHPRYGTTHRILYIIVGLQIFTILASGGDMILLGEAYAFGVVWSFVFNSASMLLLRFQDKRPREYKVPFNFTIGGIEIPVGLGLIFVTLFLVAICNFLTKEVATIGGLIFTTTIMLIFTATDYYYRHQRRGHEHHHIEQFTPEVQEEITPKTLELTRQHRLLVAIRSTQNLFMLEKSLEETDPETTDVLVMTAKMAPAGELPVASRDEMDAYDQKLMTAVVGHAEKAGKHVIPLIIPTNSPLHAVLKTAKEIGAQEVVMGASNKFTAEEQLDQIAFYWMNLNSGNNVPLSIRILGQDRDVYFDLNGGARIPKMAERRARSVDELRAHGHGVDRVLLLHDSTSDCSDLFKGVLTMLDEKVHLGLVEIQPPSDEEAVTTAPSTNGEPETWFERDRETAERLERNIEIHPTRTGSGEEIVELAQANKYDLIIVALSHDQHYHPNAWQRKMVDFLLRHAPCRIFAASPPVLPEKLAEQPPTQ